MHISNRSVYKNDLKIIKCKHGAAAGSEDLKRGCKKSYMALRTSPYHMMG